jgi:hypothetical protein
MRPDLFHCPMIAEQSNTGYRVFIVRFQGGLLLTLIWHILAWRETIYLLILIIICTATTGPDGGD